MQFKGYRLGVILLVVIATFGLLWGAQYLAQREIVDRPLFRLYEDYGEVQGFNIAENNGVTEIEARLGKVENLRQVYMDLDRKTSAVLGDKPYVLKVTDNRDTDLEEAYYQLHYALQEGIATGQFTAMKAAVEERAQELRLDYRLYVDTDRVYLALYSGDRYLYEVVSRPATKEDTA